MSLDKQDATPGQPSPELKFRKSPDFKAVYTNWVQGAFTPFDISLVVAEAYPGDHPQIFDIDLKLRLTFSPVEAKIAATILGSTIAMFERDYGEIKIPETVRATEIPTSRGETGEGSES